VMQEEIVTETVPLNNEEIKLLYQMLCIPSYSHREQELAEFLRGEIERRGMRSWIDGAGNPVAELGQGKRTIIFLGHIDTVAGDIPVRFEGGKLYGRGAVDAKGPMAAYLSAATRLLAKGKRIDKRIVIIGAVEEEAATSKGARQVVKDYRPDYCVIGEPSGWSAITLGYKGRLLAKYTLRRSMTHTASAESSACEQAVRFWNYISSYAASFNENKKIFDSFQPSIRSINTTGDGNIEEVVMRLGFRLPLGFDSNEFIADLQLRKGNASLEFSGAEVAYRADKSNPLVRAFLQAIRARGGAPKFKVKTGTSDMNVVGPVWQCPILAYGPGDSGLDHTPNEHIEISEYLASIDVLEMVMESL